MVSRVKRRRIKAKVCIDPNCCCDDEVVASSQKRNKKRSISQTKRQTRSMVSSPLKSNQKQRRLKTDRQPGSIVSSSKRYRKLIRSKTDRQPGSIVSSSPKHYRKQRRSKTDRQPGSIVSSSPKHYRKQSKSKTDRQPGLEGFPVEKGDARLLGRGLSDLPGPSGECGFEARPGPSGLSGLKADSGLSGFTGNKGETILHGLPGLCGQAGLSGLKGESGFPGVPEFKGEVGETGLPDLPDPEGEDDFDTPGLSGLDGFEGEKGDSGYPGPPATCIICKRSFTNKKKFNDHNAKHHFFRHCPNCPATFQQTRKFVLHLRSHLHDHPYECKICLLCFQKKQLLLNHKKEGHEDLKAFTCNTCSEEFINFPSLARHRLIHTPPYVCRRCHTFFSNVRDRDVHMRNHLRRCLLCPPKVVTFTEMDDLMYHMFFDHTLKEGGSGYKVDYPKFHNSTGTGKLEEDSDSDSMDDYCSSDNDSVPDIDNNYQAEAVEPVYNLKHKNKFFCFICYTLYPSPEMLKSHMKPHDWYPCNSCPRFFADYETFKKHKQDCTGHPFFICKNYGTKSECKNCGAEIECKNCKKNLSNATGDISEDSIIVSSRQGMPFPKMPRYPFTKYCVGEIRGELINFIHYIKSKDKPLDVFRISHIGSHIANLELILEDEDLQSLFLKEWIPDIEFLYSKFQDLCQNLDD